MNLNLSGKKALITGSSQGIGFFIAKALNKQGCDVVLNSRNSLSLEKALKDIPGSKGFVADISSFEGAKYLIEKTIESIKSLDILICNVGNGKSVPPGNESPEEWQKVFANNLWSTTNMVEASWDLLSKNKGVVVCISSICGIEVIPSAPITYSTAKAALNHYVKSISKPLGKHGVRINAIAPGNILFEGSVWDKKIKKNPKGVETMLKKEVSLNKIGHPSHIADLSCYLCSPLSSFTTGSIWTVDGGQVRS